MKILILLMLIAMAPLAASSKQTKPTLIVDQFSGNGDTDAIIQLRKYVFEAIRQTSRLNVVTKDSLFKSQQDTIPSKFILKGELDSLTVIGKEDTRQKNPEFYYLVEHESNLTITISDAADGTIIKQACFKYDGPGSTAERAAKRWVSRKANLIKRFIDNTLDVAGHVSAINEEHNGVAKTVYINLGSSDGLKQGSHLHVFKEIHIAGKIAWKIIGEIQVNEIMNNGRSLCGVKSKGDIIATELKKGTRLFVEPYNTIRCTIPVFADDYW